jgi:hypothetical protein
MHFKNLKSPKCVSTADHKQTASKQEEIDVDQPTLFISIAHYNIISFHFFCHRHCLLLLPSSIFPRPFIASRVLFLMNEIELSRRKKEEEEEATRERCNQKVG